VKVGELVAFLLTHDQNLEVGYERGDDYGGFEEIDGGTVKEDLRMVRSIREDGSPGSYIHVNEEVLWLW